MNGYCFLILNENSDFFKNFPVGGGFQRNLVKMKKVKGNSRDISSSKYSRLDVRPLDVCSWLTIIFFSMQTAFCLKGVVYGLNFMHALEFPICILFWPLIQFLILPFTTSIKF